MPRTTTGLVVSLGLAALAGAMGCKRDEPAGPPPPPPHAPPGATTPAMPAAAPSAIAPPTAPDPDVVRGGRMLMSTPFQITVVTTDRARAEPAIDAALDEIARLEALLSEWRPESEISRVNQAAGTRPVAVGPELFANVKASLEMAEFTRGAFDITWAALHPYYRFRQGEERVPDLDVVREKLPLVNFRDVRLDERAHSVFLARPGMAIGLGGIAKGYAADRAADVLRRAGFESFMVFAGGQVLVHGMRGTRAWRVGVQHPRGESYIAFVEVTDASVATSGDYEHAFITPEGRRWHHIVDPETGLPATRSTSVTLIAPSGLLADGLDTGCFIMGPEACLTMLAELRASGRAPNIEAIILDDRLKLWTTPGTRERLVMRVALDAEGRIPPH